jgi:5-methylcytosine-specific restriction endonuclease McrA
VALSSQTIRPTMTDKRVEFTRAVKLAAWRRCSGRCENCGCLLGGKVPHYDHRNPETFSHDASLGNCAVLCVECHDRKTNGTDKPAIAKSNRIRVRHAGIRRERTIRSWRNFAGVVVIKPRER